PPEAVRALMGDDLWRWPAYNLAHAIRTRQISGREAVRSCLARLEQVNPQINAVVDLLADQALAAAERADRAVSAGEALGPLHGVPVTSKINPDSASGRTTKGMLACRD